MSNIKITDSNGVLYVIELPSTLNREEITQAFMDALNRQSEKDIVISHLKRRITEMKVTAIEIYGQSQETHIQQKAEELLEI